MIELVLPYPVSANRYWRPVRIGDHITIVPTKDAKRYKANVATAAIAAGIRKPIIGRVAVEIRLYPACPKDARARIRKDPAAWDDTVRCIDLDNASKVLVDAIKGTVIEDDRWIWRITLERMLPFLDGKVALRVMPIVMPQPHASLELFASPKPEKPAWVSPFEVAA